ncbi:sulfatase-like hydrolase/transferase [Stieleria sp. JC731]|uniref:sulfatase-like hydrolase/transferase n=1 Tax=Pirellulaceae TaxID=2691357 RepID=UPI001E313632|nr:sulfatase-like hydrolase/transferase [Stieleria sp. JC731]MCC9599660.1 sulfatase-like hydrolase/transferase [Stieleria sp. JC731]
MHSVVLPAVLSLICCLTILVDPLFANRPNIVLVMADDQGWGETGYNGHPILKTPHLDAMSENGLRFDRFYAGAPVCSPTRAAVLTGRSCYRVGVPEHGYALRHQEVALPQVLSDAGYQTAHFGKWHLNGLRGPGAPIFSHDPFNPGRFGFQYWLSVTNFYDRDPLLSRNGNIEDYKGDSSDVIVEQSMRHITELAKRDSPFFVVIWYGTPHSPFKASEQDMAPFKHLDEASMHHYGELVALDRSVGAIRKGLRDLNIEKETVLWYCSDNGGLPRIEPPTTGGLRGNKGQIDEGGLRVPGIIEWPETIKPRRTSFPASVMDMMPTILELAETKHPIPERPADGISLRPLFDGTQPDGARQSPIFFRYKKSAAMVDNAWKLTTRQLERGPYELYNLASDKIEKHDVGQANPDRLKSMTQRLKTWLEATDASEAGKDYPEGEVDTSHPQPMYWTERDDYQAYLDQWKDRWEYAGWLKRRSNRK